MRRWTSSRRQPLLFKAPRMTAYALRVIIAASHIGPWGEVWCAAAFHKHAWCLVSTQMARLEEKCWRSGAKHCLLVVKTSWVLLPFQYLASSTAQDPSLLGEQGLALSCSSPAVGIHRAQAQSLSPVCPHHSWWAGTCSLGTKLALVLRDLVFGLRPVAQDRHQTIFSMFGGQFQLCFWITPQTFRPS